MGNERFLLLFHDARLRFLELLGFSEKDIGGGIGLIMKEAHVNYKAEVFMGEELRVGVMITDLQQVQFNMQFQVERDSDHKTTATGYTRMVAFDIENRKVCKIPDEFKTRLALYLNSFKTA